MATRKNALLIFSKPPIPGLVKTRLTKEHGGIFTPEMAADLFKRSLFDVCEMCMWACLELAHENEEARAADPSTDTVIYDFFVSTTPADNVDLMKQTFEELGEWPMTINYLTDAGATFDEHFNDAFKQLFDRGYESIVSVGGDIPTMPKTHITQAFRWLEYFHDQGTPGFVEAPCQECGTSLVGFSFDTPIDHDGIYYNLDGRPALDGYCEKIREHDIPSIFLSPVADIDEAEDFAHAVSCIRAIALAGPHQPELYVPKRVLDWIDYYGFKASTPPNENHDPRNYIDE